MQKMTVRLLMLLALLVSLASASAWAGGNISAAAAKEGKLYIYGALDRRVADALVKEFNSVYPGIAVDFVALDSSQVFSWYVGDIAAKKVSADILWSGDIRLQAALARDGFGQPYKPAETAGIMATAAIGDAVFVSGFEPVVMVYNKKLLAGKDLPLSRNALMKALKSEQWRGKVAVCDPEKSDTAFLILTQDLAHGQDLWGLVRRFGDAGLKIYPDYRTLLEKVGSGEAVLGYNVPLGEVLKAGDNPALGWSYTADYNLALPQTLLISKRATHPDAAGLWVDFVRSRRGQEIVSTGSNLFPVRSDVVGGEMQKRGGQPPAGVLRMAGSGVDVTRFNDDGMKRGFLLRWKQLLKLVK